MLGAAIPYVIHSIAHVHDGHLVDVASNGFHQHGHATFVKIPIRLRP